jgi:hypothetical protein
MTGKSLVRATDEQAASLKALAWGRIAPTRIVRALSRDAFGLDERHDRQSLRRTRGHRAAMSFVAWMPVGFEEARLLNLHTAPRQIGLPRVFMRLSALTAIATSVLRRASLRDFNVSPMTRLWRLIAASALERLL